MHPLSTLLLALAMSTDAFAAALGKGAGLNRPHPREALRIGLIFGSIEATAPLIGWILGQAAAGRIATIDHWLAFVLLAGVGIKMIHDSFRRAPDAQKPRRHGFLILALTAMGTSIDALVVGATLALIGAPILVNAAAIGLATFTMATIGVLAGHRLGTGLGRHAEMAGGLVLILIGSVILFEHLSGQMG